MGCYSALKGNKILIHATTWMNLKDFMLNEIKWVTQLCWILCNPMDYSPWNSPGQNTGVGSHSLLQGIFLTQVSHVAGRFFISWVTREARISHIHAYIHSLPDSIPIEIITEYQRLPCAVKYVFIICFIYSIVYTSISVSQFIPLNLLSPLVIMFVLYMGDSNSVL